MATVFLSYRYQNDAHRERVHTLGEQLRAAKVEVMLDQFFLEAHPAGPYEGWPAWSKRQAGETEKLLIIASAGWFRCYEGTEVPGSGLGGAAETSVIAQRLYNEAGVNTFARVVVFDPADAKGVPLDLQGYHRFDPARDLAAMITWITGAAPAASLAAIGRVPQPTPRILASREEPTAYQSKAQMIPSKIFISYSRVDKPWLERLQCFLKSLERDIEITVFTDTDIRSGENWHLRIQSELADARVAILLISQPFLRSEYIANSELPVLLRRAREEGLPVLPIFLSPSTVATTRFKYPDPKNGPEEFTLTTWQAINSPDRTLTEMKPAVRDRTFVRLVEAVRKAVGPLPSR